jgi:hypothetical protein
MVPAYTIECGAGPIADPAPPPPPAPVELDALVELLVEVPELEVLVAVEEVALADVLDVLLAVEPPLPVVSPDELHAMATTAEDSTRPDEIALRMVVLRARSEDERAIVNIAFTRRELPEK